MTKDSLIMAWQQRDDNVHGQIYLMKAIGYGGLIPGCLIGRYKIGLSIFPDIKPEVPKIKRPMPD